MTSDQSPPSTIRDRVTQRHGPASIEHPTRVLHPTARPYGLRFPPSLFSNGKSASCDGSNAIYRPQTIPPKKIRTLRQTKKKKKKIRRRRRKGEAERVLRGGRKQGRPEIFEEHKKRQTMAGISRMMQIVLIVAVTMFQTSIAKNVTVGDGQGWGLSTNYAQWVRNKSFAVGDILGT